MFELMDVMTEVALQNGDNGGPVIDGQGMAALAVGLAALAAGYAERGIGAAAVGAIAEDRDMFVPGIVLTVLPETIVIFALLVVILLL